MFGFPTADIMMESSGGEAKDRDESCIAANEQMVIISNFFQFFWNSFPLLSHLLLKNRTCNTRKDLTHFPFFNGLFMMGVVDFGSTFSLELFPLEENWAYFVYVLVRFVNTGSQV